MDVAEEDGAQIAKRQAIQAIMRDSSLSPQDKQRKIQELMASGGAAAGAPASSPAPAPASAPSPKSSETATSGGVATNGSTEQQGGVDQTARRQAIQQIMKDSSLTPQEKQRKIQEFMASGAGTTAASLPAPASAPTQQLKAVTPSTTYANPETSRQQSMQAVMQDPNLTPQEKQQKIQAVLGSSASQATELPSESRPSTARQSFMHEVMTDTSLSSQEKQQKIQQILGNSNEPEPSQPPMSQPNTTASTSSVAGTSSQQAIQEVMRDSSLTPQQKQQRIQQIMRTGPAPGASAATPTSQATTSSSVTESDADAKARARGTPSSIVAPGAVASSPSTATPPPSDFAVPPASSSSYAGAVSSTGADPASRKVNRRAEDGPGVTSRTADPAARKAARGSARSGASSTVASAASAASVSSAMENDRSIDDNSSAAVASENRDLRGTDASVVIRPPPVPESEELPPQQNVYEDPGITRDLDQRAPLVPQGHGQPTQSIPTPVQVQPPRANQPNSYAGLSYAPDTAGADEGGFEAYVADADLAVDAAEVVTEQQLAEMEEKKASMYIKKGGALLCFLLIIIIVPVAVVVPKGPTEVEVTDAPTAAPSAAPTTAAYAELLAELRSLYDNDQLFDEAFSDVDSPQSRAASWAGLEDTQGLSGDDPRMLSRYSLATFYFATNGDDWLRCGRGSTSCDKQSEWLTGPNECNWLAISCIDPGNDDYTVDEIFFVRNPADNNIRGTLPFEISLLSGLTSLTLSTQFLKGSIPDSWGGRMSTLEALFLGWNELTGPFPGFLLDSNPQLRTISLLSNQLSGPLPTTLMSTSLTLLDIGQNGLTGPIPSGIIGMPGLNSLVLEDNFFTGSIPDELYLLPNLRSIRMSNNTGLTGTLSKSINNVQGLQTFELANTGVFGSLPSELFELTALTNLQLGFNSLSFGLSESFANLVELNFAILNNNNFQGPIPSAFATLPKLRELRLEGNDLTGSVSDAICEKKGDGFFDLSYLSADCLGNPPEVACSCCNNCNSSDVSA